MLDYNKLVTSGRAKAIGTPWTAEELELLISLEKERGVIRLRAADYIRNGIESLEDYDRAVKKDFKPLTIEEAEKKAEKDLKKEGKKAISKRKK